MKLAEKIISRISEADLEIKVPSKLPDNIKFKKEGLSTLGTVTHRYFVYKNPDKEKLKKLVALYGFKDIEFEYLGANKFGTYHLMNKGKKIATVHPDDGEMTIFTGKKSKKKTRDQMAVELKQHLAKKLKGIDHIVSKYNYSDYDYIVWVKGNVNNEADKKVLDKVQKEIDKFKSPLLVGSALKVDLAKLRKI
jgi:hypothetical protein